MSNVVQLLKKRIDGSEAFCYNDPKSLLIVAWTKPSSIACQRMPVMFRIRKSTLRKLLRGMK
jgi:hypothetical protein